ncbi:MAG: VCBS repeat-containing protein [Lachnospiraceae bacterium]|nr:VCBS repeat-containing protein [Lachnospiraceae bacterium]
MLCVTALLISTVFSIDATAQEAVQDNIAKEYNEYTKCFDAINTLEDIKAQGYEIVEKHVFDIPLVTKSTEVDEDGEFLDTEVTRPIDINIISDEDAVVLQSVPTVRFVTAIDKKYHRAAVFLADKDGTIVYKTNTLECNYTIRGQLEQPIVDMVSVAFADMNHDGLMDIILIAGCVNDSGGYSGQLYKVGEVLFQKKDAISFYRDWRVNDKLNRFGMNKSAKCIISFVRDGNSTEFLYTATTEQELMDNGFRVIEEQSYWRTYEKLGQLKVLPGTFSMADYDIFMIYMVNRQGNIVWSFQPMGDMDNLYSLKGMSGKDMDGDGMKDLVVWAQYSKEGEHGELLVENRCSVYYQRTGGFDTDTDFVENYQFTSGENMEMLLSAIRAYWGWSE